MTKAMSKAQLRSKGSKVSVTLTNHTPLYTTMFGHGEKAGIGARAKLDAALDFQRLVKDGTVDVSTDELRKAAIADAVEGYDAGMAKALGREPSNADSLKTLRSEFGTFIRADVLSHAADTYKLIGAAVAGKSSKEVITDQFQQHTAINRAIDAAKGVPAKSAIVEKLSKDSGDDADPKEKAKAQLKQLLKIAEVLSKAKAGISKAQKHAIVELLTALA